MGKNLGNCKFFFVGVDFISSDAEYCFLKPVKSVIVENRQTNFPFWRVV